MGKQFIVVVQPFVNGWSVHTIENNSLTETTVVEKGDLNNFLLQPDVDKVLFYGNLKYTDKLIENAKNAEFSKYNCQKIIFEQKENFF